MAVQKSEHQVMTSTDTLLAAGPIMPQDCNETYVFEYSHDWPKNPTSSDEKRAQRAYFSCDAIGLKLLNTSAIYKICLGKGDLKANLLEDHEDGHKLLLNPQHRLSIKFKDGRIDDITLAGEPTKKLVPLSAVDHSKLSDEDQDLYDYNPKTKMFDPK